MNRNFSCFTALAMTLTLFDVLAMAQDGGRYAVIVGVEQYDHNKLDPLEYAEDDARDLAGVLEKVGYKVALLCDSEGKKNAQRIPTKANITTVLSNLTGKTQRNDTILVAFMGHGLHFTGEPDSYFCPKDARPLPDRKDTLVPLGDVYSQLDNSGAGVKVLLVDACRNDPNPARGRGIDADSAPRPPSGVAVLFSCSKGERAYEHKSLGHGVFTHFLLEGLKGAARDTDGEVTFETLAGYVKKQTARAVPSLIGLGLQQSPNLKADLSGVPPVLLSSSDLERLRGGELELTNSIGMKLRRIPAGEFLMGSPGSDEDASDDEKPAHRVRISQAFYLGTYEVTKGQFARFVSDTSYRTEAEKDGMGGWGYDSDGKFGQKPEYTWRNPGFSQADDHPVVNVSWNDAVAFCAWLSRKEGATYRLPTEAEFEYANRAGSTSIYQHGNNPEGLAQIGNVADGTAKAKFSDWTTINARDGYIFTAPVGRFRANAFGLYDMTGNVWEWCSDGYDNKYYQASPSTDPTGAASGSDRVNRGGGWGSHAAFCRSAVRFSNAPDYRFDDLGFRVARSSAR